MGTVKIKDIQIRINAESSFGNDGISYIQNGLYNRLLEPARISQGETLKNKPWHFEAWSRKGNWNNYKHQSSRKIQDNIVRLVFTFAHNGVNYIDMNMVEWSNKVMLLRNLKIVD